ncbi:hypothetical protein [Hymenobacter cellulosilyticus]|uniref:Uncharacterized protein n=1 Tax=Hymenobacter cellulosilyticus TaxID=2932248 RepID=A0A8T9Q437_9BACT|nr:hypothetical protein [Hymenobacter cellulosilyticus]UOQ70658.1 hypothetical protein MUN79_18370 [Hymenobacter cellulosilyticus]
MRRNRLLLGILVLPVVLVLAASALRVYPFHERFLLFLAPLLMLLAGFGIETLARQWARRPVWLYGLLVLFLAPAVVGVGRQLAAPGQFMNTEFNREVLLHLNDRYRAGDAVYVFWNMNQAYDYYSLAYPLRYRAIAGSYVKNTSASPADYLQNLQLDFRQFAGKKRLWFVYDKTNGDAIGDYVGQPAWYHQPGFNAPEYLEQHFATLGRKVYHHQRFPYTVVLYELTPTPRLKLMLLPPLTTARKPSALAAH